MRFRVWSVFGSAGLIVGRLRMDKRTQAAFVISGLVILISAAASVFNSSDRRPPGPTVTAAPQALFKHDWTIRVGSGTYGVCQSHGGQGEEGMWTLYFGSGCIHTATSVRFQQLAAGVTLLGIALMLSVSTVALLRLRRASGLTKSLHSTSR